MFDLGRIYKRREELHHRYGGQQQGGISTPSGYPCMFIFTGENGNNYGYQDGWNSNGIFLYTGEGQIGDMQYVRGNKAIRDHIVNGKDIHVFESNHTPFVKYLGQMICIGFHESRGPDINGNDRLIIVFELSPIEQYNATDFSNTELLHDSLGELRKKALQSSSNNQTPIERKALYRQRSEAIKLYVTNRANGVCENCNKLAPFITAAGTPFLEAHHIRRLSDGGPDHPSWVAAICPNCHREAHYGAYAYQLNSRLSKVIQAKEAELL